MIQRIQSVYLFLVFVISVVMLFVPISNYELNDNSRLMPHSGQLNLLTNGYYLGFIIEILIMMLILFTIFRFKNRKQQIKLCWLIIILLIVLLIYCFFGITFFTFGYALMFSLKNVHYLIGFYLPFISIVLCILAIRAIKKDDELVRAADRLR